MRRRTTLSRPTTPRRPTASRLPFHRTLRCEPLEDRRMLSVLFVDADAASGGDGLAWGTAYRDLQDALSQAAAVNADGDTGNDVDQIWVAEGVYKPSAELEPGDPRSASFSLVDGVGLFGGFAGTEANLEDRDTTGHVTTLSGDLGVVDDTSDNAWTIAYCGDGIEALLDGLSITKGMANESYYYRAFRGKGGGIYNDNGMLTVTECTFVGNYAMVGAGISNYKGTVTVTDAEFAENSGGCGGGISNEEGIVTVMNSTFSDNSATCGGGIHNEDGSLTLTGGTLSNNLADQTGGGISNFNGVLTVTNSTLLENSADGIRGQGGGIFNSGTFTLADSTISDNVSNWSGGGIVNNGTMTMASTTLSDNSADDLGGGIVSNGTATIGDSTFLRNVAGEFGGGIASGKTLKLTNSILSGNSAGDFGAGIYSTRSGVVMISNSLLSGNSLKGDYSTGGGIYSEGMLTVANSTFSGNSAALGGGIYGDEECSIVLDNSIFWQNLGGDIDGSETISGSTNLIEVDPRFVRNPSDGGDGWGDDLDTRDIDESANDDYGDLRLTAPSPAIDYGNDAVAVDGDGNPLTADLDDNPRNYDGSPVDVGAYEYQGEMSADREDASLTVTTSEDVFDQYDGRVSLREAIHYAGIDFPDATITFDAALDGATITLSGTPLWIDKGLAVDASALTALTIDADQQSRAFTVVAHHGNPVELNHLVITGGLADNGGAIYTTGDLTVADSMLSENSTTGDGGAVYNDTGTLTVTNSTFSNNLATESGHKGGAIYTDAGTLTVAGSTFARNAAYSGGAIFGNSGVMEVSTSILSGNAARGGSAGAIYSSGTLTVTNSVVVGNSAEYGGGINNYGTLTITNSTILGSLGSSDGTLSPSTLRLTNSIVWWNGGEALSCSGAVSASHNLIGIDPKFARNPSDGGDGWGDDPATPEIDESANDDFGDLRLTAQSPAIDYGDAELAVDANDDPLTTDFDGSPRVYGDKVDVGAFEFEGEAAAGREAPSLTVNTPEDVFDLYDGQVSLREGIYYAGSGSLETTVTFDDALDGARITLAGAALWVDKRLRVDASSLNSLTIDAGSKSRVFAVNASAEDAVELSNLTMTGGLAADGGGICNLGMLTVTDCTLFGNVASGYGGGIRSNGTLTVMNTTFWGNAAGFGGGIRNSGTLTVTNSTFSGNTARFDGGGIYSYEGVVSVTNSTLAGNKADDRGGGICYRERSLTAVLTLNNSIVAKNAAPLGPDLNLEQFRGPLTSSHNLIGDGSGHSLISGVDGNTVGSPVNPVDPSFARTPSDGGDGWGDDSDTPDINESANDDYGDLRLTAHSRIIDLGNDALAVDANGNPLGTDLDGNNRIYGESVDCGAFEFQDSPAVEREAASLTVNTAEDVFDLYDGWISLREAIHYAGVDSLGTRITFDAALDGATITLYGAPLGIDKSLTIDASSLTSLTIDADEKSRAFQVMASDQDEVELNTLTITGGFAAEHGGGIYNDQSTLAVVNSTVSENVANGNGGGIYNNSGALTVTNCVLSGNSATGTYGSGGGIYIGSGTLTVTNCALFGNVANDDGGGIRNYHSTVSIMNSVLSGNSAGDDGGGISCGYLGTLSVTGSTLAGNSAKGDGGGAYTHGGGSSSATFDNTILAQNTASSGMDLRDNAYILSGSHSLIGVSQGQCAFHNGIDGNLVGTSSNPLDPLFIRSPSDGGDGWGDDPSTPDIDESANDDYGDLRLRPDSPAVDAGSTALLPEDSLDLDADGDTTEPIPFDLAGNTRVSGAAVDMGAYEFLLSGIPGDLNNDSMVNSSDLDIIRANWGQTVTPGSLLDGDPTGDGTVNSDDLNIVRANWGSTMQVAAGVGDTKSERVARRDVTVATRQATDAALRNWARARRAWAEALEALARERASETRRGERDKG